MEKRIQWKQHQGQRILALDTRDASRAEQQALLEAYEKALQAEPDASVRLLFLGGDLDFHPDIVTKARAAFSRVQHKVKRSAVVGLKGVLKVAVEGYVEARRLMGDDSPDKAVPFEAEEAALDWLAQG